MTKIYACLLGEWVDLGDDPSCVMGLHREAPLDWWRNSADVYAPEKREEEHQFKELDYVLIYYKGVTYRINPIFLQVVSTSE
ncbi:hypothetical protein ACKQTC_03005 [Peptococcus simiae]|uniref:Uncharacterized protein n=1 Tax=Peptococcus simiae TaxID=1643805 RepID=A0ABW9GXY2_9FIRM